VTTAYCDTTAMPHEPLAKRDRRVTSCLEHGDFQSRLGIGTPDRAAYAANRNSSRARGGHARGFPDVAAPSDPLLARRAVEPPNCSDGLPGATMSGIFTIAASPPRSRRDPQGEAARLVEGFRRVPQPARVGGYRATRVAPGGADCGASHATVASGGRSAGASERRFRTRLSAAR
jgi:hypothetical protein